MVFVILVVTCCKLVDTLRRFIHHLRQNVESVRYNVGLAIFLSHINKKTQAFQYVLSYWTKKEECVFSILNTQSLKVMDSII